MFTITDSLVHVTLIFLPPDPQPQRAFTSQTKLHDTDTRKTKKQPVPVQIGTRRPGGPLNATEVEEDTASAVQYWPHGSSVCPNT